MKPVLVTFSRKGARKEFDIGDVPRIIGRSPEADIQIPVSDVSRSHCEIVVSGKKVVIRDLGSSNGTFVNDRKIKETSLKAGDLIRVGPVQFTMQIDGVPAKIVPLKPAAQAPKAAPEEPTRIAAPAAEPGSEEFDLDQLEELDAEDLSDFDIDELTGTDASGVIEEVDGVEEISEDELLSDDDSKNAK